MTLKTSERDEYQRLLCCLSVVCNLYSDILLLTGAEAMKKKIVMIWDLNWTFLRAFVAVLCVKMRLGGCKREL
jgi:hypothetical protein